MYKSTLSKLETQRAIQKIESFFAKKLNEKLNLTKVNSPVFVETNTCLNDGLNGEEPVKFSEPLHSQSLEIVHSLAKWKRHLLDLWDFQEERGIFANMIAVRKEEKISNIHSYLVDQWDWERVINKEDRNQSFLHKIVKEIFEIFKETEDYICSLFPSLSKKLPQEIFFINSQELEDLYPNLTPQQREDEIAKAKKAVFIEEVGFPLKSGVVHSARAVDYDDWTLNGDIIVYNRVLDKGLELSSMGIRVDKNALIRQSNNTAQQLSQKSEFHKSIVEETIPFTIGGGIGKSRVFMFLLEKFHIGEVQFSYWPSEMREKAKEAGAELL